MWVPLKRYLSKLNLPIEFQSFKSSRLLRLYWASIPQFRIAGYILHLSSSLWPWLSWCARLSRRTVKQRSEKKMRPRPCVNVDPPRELLGWIWPSNRGLIMLEPEVSTSPSNLNIAFAPLLCHHAFLIADDIMHAPQKWISERWKYAASSLRWNILLCLIMWSSAIVIRLPLHPHLFTSTTPRHCDKWGWK